MNAFDFFSKSITDNCFKGISLKDITLDKDFNCETRRSEIEHKRKQGILEFIKVIYKFIGSKNVADLQIKTMFFDEEFDANIEQKMFSLSGIGYSDLKLHTGNIIGSINYNGLSFNINCRFGDSFLAYMIANTSGFLELEDMGSFQKDTGSNNWILIYYWKLKLKKAFALGMYKTYQRKQAELLSIRGTVDINAIIKKKYVDGRILCHFKEHSYQNEVNRVISKTIKKVFSSKYFPLVADIYNIKNAFDPFTTESLNITNKDLNLSVINPYFAGYKDVVTLSQMILNDEFSNVDLSNNKCSAFLFDVSLLFEHHIRKTLKETFQLKPKNTLEYLIPNGVYENALYPDIIIDHGNKKISIYDVKYKYFNKTHGVERDDRFQLSTYVSAYINDYEVIGCGIIYPTKDLNSLRNLKYEQFLRVAGKSIPFLIKHYQVMNNIDEQYVEDRLFVASFN